MTSKADQSVQQQLADIKARASCAAMNGIEKFPEIRSHEVRLDPTNFNKSVSSAKSLPRIDGRRH
jgi:hypothetical protein